MLRSCEETERSCTQFQFHNISVKLLCTVVEVSNEAPGTWSYFRKKKRSEWKGEMHKMQQDVLGKHTETQHLWEQL